MPGVIIGTLSERSCGKIQEGDCLKYKSRPKMPPGQKDCLTYWSRTERFSGQRIWLTYQSRPKKLPGQRNCLTHPWRHLELDRLAKRNSDMPWRKK